MAQRLDPLASTPPAFDFEAIKRILRDRFGVEASSLAPLAGERDQNLRVDTADGRRLLFKISNPADGLSTVEMQAAALRHIERVDPGLPVMRVVPDTVGESWAEVRGPDGRTYPVRLFTFLPGRVTANTALTTQAIRSFGQTTARLGRALRGFFHPAADYEILWDLTHAAKLRVLLNHVSDAGRRARCSSGTPRCPGRARRARRRPSPRWRAWPRPGPPAARPPRPPAASPTHSRR